MLSQAETAKHPFSTQSKIKDTSIQEVTLLVESSIEMIKLQSVMYLAKPQGIKTVMVGSFK